ncbi:hypothetical protein A2U01_0089610, partial [Trifolium medium]|nr:hypothetical protein [Trifolium medium]
SEDGEDLQVLTERQVGKRPQERQEIPVDKCGHSSCARHPQANQRDAATANPE